MSSTSYRVFAGDERPPTVIGQHLEKKQGQTLTAQGGDKVLYVNRRGDIGFPNRTEIWGVRLDKDGKIPDSDLNVKDGNYKGQIKPLKWGDKKGQLITCRYLKGYDTLDYLYQNLVLNADVNIKDTDESSSDAFFVVLQSGENEFSEVTDKMKVEFLKICSYNQNSISKHPDRVDYMFKEITDAVVLEETSKNLDSKSDALFIVKTAAKDNSLSQLRNLRDIIGVLITDEVTDKNLYGSLLKLADSDYDGFLSQIEKHKIAISNVIEKAKSYKALDWTKDGVLAAGVQKKEIIGTDMEGKGEKMVQWCMDNYLDAKAYETIHKLTQITDKL